MVVAVSPDARSTTIRERSGSASTGYT